MPVVMKTHGTPTAGRHGELARELACELAHPRAFGQPMVEQEEFARTGLIGVSVIWDRFEECRDVDRPGVIHDAYKQAGMTELTERFAYAVGYTVPDAIEASLLTRSVSVFGGPDIGPAEYRAFVDALIELGASRPRDGNGPVLWFQNDEQAGACRQELWRRFPDWKHVWAWSQPR